MIYSCTCTGVSTSTLGSSKRRASTASCKSCCGKQLVDWRGSPSSSMLSTVGLELTSLINSDLTWNKVSKGNRSSSRRARKSLELGWKTSWEVVNKEVDMPVSESEKLGVTVLGCRFSEKAEHVPIKKRRFLFRTPSPPPRTLSSHPEETETIVKRQNVPGHGFPQNSCQLANSGGAASVDLGQIVDSEVNINGKNLVKVDERRDENEDFSGISILAAAACSNSLGGYFEEGSGVEEPLGHEGTLELMNVEARDELVNSAEISTEGTGSCISPSPAEEDPASLRTDYSSREDLPLENMTDATSFQESPVTGSFSNKDDANFRAQESSARDDRLHWDLNTVMDAWEQPFDCQHVDSPANVADGISEYADDSKHSDGNKNLEGHEFQRAPEGTNDNTGNALPICELRRLAMENQELNIEEDKLDSCMDINRAIFCQGNMLSSEIDHAKDVVMDPDKNKESSHSQEKINLDVGSGSSIPAEHTSRPLASDIIDGNVSASWVKSGTAVNTESLSSHQVGSRDSPVDYSLPPDSGHLTSTNVFEENCNAASTNAISVQSMEDCAGDPQTDGTMFSSSPLEKQNDTFPGEVVLDKATYDIGNALNGDVVDAWRSSELLVDGNIIKSMACEETGQGPIDDVRESAACESDKSGSSQSHHANSVAPTSGAFLGGQPVAPVDTMVQHCESFLVCDNTETDTQVLSDAEEPTVMSSGKSMAVSVQPCGLSSLDACRNYHDDVSHGKIALEEPLGDGYDTDVSQGDRGVVVGIEKSSDLRVDYDSQYEDGELRESSVHAWEEYDCDYEETERVDYGSDNRDTNNVGSENTEESNFEARLGSSSRTKVNDAGSSRERAVGTSSPCLRVQNSEKVDIYDKVSESGPDQRTRDDKDNNRQDNIDEANQSADLKMKMSGWDRLPENRGDTSDMSSVRYGSIRNNFTSDRKDGSDAEDTEMKVFPSGVIRREFVSRIERPVSRGVFLRRGRLGIQGSSTNDDDSNPTFERQFDTAKSFGRGRYSLQRGRRGGRWADYSGSERGLKRHRSPTYYGMASFHRSGPKDVASDSTIMKEGGAGSSSQASRQATNASFHGLHRSLRRSGSPTVRQETFDAHRGIRAAGEMSPDRFVTFGRGRSVRYGPRVSNGGPRGRYNGPVNDNYDESSLNYSHPFTRRRRSFSPMERRGNPPAHRSSSKSPSRSRTRSPNAWQSPRGRNVAGNLGFRQRSRSPNFRSGTRMPRVRSPHLRSGFVPDHEIGLMSAPRTRDSPPPNSKWIGYKQRSSLIDRRSPGRIGMRGERFDMLDSPRKLKPNEYYRSVHPGRFSELNGVGRGGPRYGGDDNDRGKHGYRSRLVHPVKRYDLEGAVKRFRYDVEDGFVAGHDSRDKEATDFHGRPKAYSSRGFDSRIGGDVPRRTREERGPFFHRQDRKYNTNSKPFGMRECEEDLDPRRRPS